MPIQAVIGRPKGRTSTEVQSFIFSPKTAWSRERAKRWLGKYGKRSGQVEETGGSFRFRQKPPANFQSGTFRTISISDNPRDAIGDWAQAIADNLLEDYESLRSIGWSAEDARAEVLRRSIAGPKTVQIFVKLAGESEMRHKAENPGLKIAPKQFSRLLDLAGRDAAQQSSTSMQAFEDYANEIGWPWRATKAQRQEWREYSQRWKNPRVAPRVGINDTEIHTWFERDRAHVELRNKRNDKTIIQWWDEEVNEAIEDGFLDPRDYHGSAYDYATYLGIIRDPSGRNPKKRAQTREQVAKKQAKAVKFLRDVVGDQAKADEIARMSVAEYAAKKKIPLENPQGYWKSGRPIARPKSWQRAGSMVGKTFLHKGRRVRVDDYEAAGSRVYVFRPEDQQHYWVESANLKPLANRSQKSEARSQKGNARPVTSYGVTRGRDWQQEWYESKSGDSRIRAAQLRKLGFRVSVSGMGPQVTPVGTVRMTILTIHNAGDREIPPPDRVERMGNPRLAADRARHVGSGKSFVQVTMTRADVETFKRSWPASGLPTRAITFTFDPSNGDLVDIKPFDIDGDAASALADDAKRFAVEKGKLPSFAAPR